MSHFHVRVHWSKAQDWSGWIDADNRCHAIDMFIKHINVQNIEQVPASAEITLRQGTTS